MTLEILRVAGLRGERDRRAVADILRAAPGVRRAVVSLADRTVRFEREDAASLAAILSALAAAGYEATVLV